MRAGRVAAIAGAACLTAACGAPAGVAGVSTEPPTPPPSSPASGGGAATAATAAASVIRPEGGDPVRLPPPKLSRFTYEFPIRGCRVSYEARLLTIPKTTIWTGKRCTFVSPISGVVKEVNVKNRWKPSTDRGPDREGRFVTVLGDDGVLYLGGHLDSVEPTVQPGVRVRAGQSLGLVGNSGNARDTNSNLYFAISWPVPSQYWWIRRGMVEPWDYLDAWLDGNRTFSPRKAMFALRTRVGTLPSCTQLCASKAPAADDKEKESDDKPDIIVVS